MVELHLKAEVDLLEIWDFILQGSGIDRIVRVLHGARNLEALLDNDPDIFR
jgi:plasmid stabilization system protein ParE